MTENCGTIEVFKQGREHIQIDTNYCFGVLDGKHFLIMRKTGDPQTTYIRWQKQKNVYMSGKNIFGDKAEKLIRLVLAKLPQKEELNVLRSQLEVMIEKNKKATLYYGKAPTKEGMHPSTLATMQEAERKKQRDIQQFLDNKAVFALKNEENKKKKEALKQARAQKKEEERQRRQQEAQERIQKQREAKALKDEHEVYNQLMKTKAGDNPVILIQQDDKYYFLGKLNEELYRVKISDTDSSFYSVSEKEINVLSPEQLMNVMDKIDSKLNFDGALTHVLENMAVQYATFVQGEKTMPIKILNNRVAIMKNILIQQGFLNQGNEKE